MRMDVLIIILKWCKWCWFTRIRSAFKKKIHVKGTRRSHNIKLVAVSFFLFLSVFWKPKKPHIYKYSARALMCSWWNASKRDQFSFNIVFIVFTIHTLNDDDDANQKFKKESKKNFFLLCNWFGFGCCLLLIDFYYVSRR